VTCRDLKLPGIPEGELLAYLCDAADALDYLFKKSAVQHLDVKPENLLLLGNRIKVADFGLVRSVGDVSASLVSFTPSYSPPEVFDGRANERSDQYSLAIVFQEMLTGKLPFDGRSPAQLAAQHMTHEPDLSSLPSKYRPAVERALSKKAEARFRSCRQFVDDLLRAPNILTMPQAQATGLRASPDTQSTVPEASADGGGANDGHTIVVDPPDIKSLPALSPVAPNTALRPAVFIGIGGTSARILRQVRRRAAARSCHQGGAPPLYMLLLDTDPDTIKNSRQGEDGSGLEQEETLYLPIRETSHYRERLGELASISRRWIYNIPRSRRTESLRPLGRIALLDHSPVVLERLSSLLSMANDRANANNATESAESCASGEPPRVFVVASISGGTGSGMVLDVAYAVRQVLDQLEMTDTDVCRVLVHSTRGHGKAHSLAVANAFACLGELGHFSHPSTRYPGEPSRGLAAFHYERDVFSSSYVIHMGDGLSAEEFGRATEQVAEYLYLNSSSPTCSSFFDECRRLERDSRGERQPDSLRTMGLSQLRQITHESPGSFVEVMCRELLERWCGYTVACEQGQPVNLVNWHEVVDMHDRKPECRRERACTDNSTVGELLSAYIRRHPCDVRCGPLA
jgi:hypothetical protein